MTSLQTHSLQRSTKNMHRTSLEQDVTTSIIYAWAVAHTLWSRNSQLTSPSVSSIYCNCSLLAWKSNITLIFWSTSLGNKTHSGLSSVWNAIHWKGVNWNEEAHELQHTSGVNWDRSNTASYVRISLSLSGSHALYCSNSTASFFLRAFFSSRAFSSCTRSSYTCAGETERTRAHMCPWERPSYRQLMDHYILRLLTDSSLPTFAAFTCTSSETFFRSNSDSFSSNSPSFLLRC